MEWWKQQYLVVKICLKYLYLKFLQNIYKTVLHVNKNNYEIQYILHDNIYKVKTKVRRGPSPIIRIMDHQQNDITNEIRTYLGPNEDFHGQSLKPLDLGYEKIHFILRHGKEVEFDINDPILF